ncbi:MAG TPA: hypothetical protein VFG51_00260 [Candidatus Saccharimonadia bacterium]|nr:hypothetical protein [Candidatus Saccharimonadia bacterium]
MLPEGNRPGEQQVLSTAELEYADAKRRADKLTHEIIPALRRSHVSVPHAQAHLDEVERQNRLKAEAARNASRR